MPTPHLPGPFTVAALMLAAVLTAWLGLWGPINLERLKDWQTLLAAIIAPSIALSAAWLAYKGAMAKVEHDRAEANLKRRTEHLALVLRLRLALERVRDQASAKIRMLTFYPSDKSLVLSQEFQVAHLSIDVPAELDEAWSRLDLFPDEDALLQIEVLRRLMPTMRDELRQLAGQTWKVEWLAPKWALPGFSEPDYRTPVAADYLNLCKTRYQQIEQSCSALLARVQIQIDSMVKR